MTATVKRFDDKHCVISAPWNAENFKKLQPPKWPGFAKWIDGTTDVRFRPTPNNIRYINEQWPDSQWIGEAQRIITDFIQEQKAAMDTASMKHKTIEDDGSYEYETDPFHHQRHVFLLSRDKKKYCLFMEQGTGKTKVAIDRAAYKYALGEIEAVVIVAPNGVHLNWVEEEIPVHLPKWVKRKCFVYSSNMTKARKKEFEEVMAAKDCLKIFAFNVEGFTSKKAKELLERILRTYKVHGVLDESQKLKNPSAVRTRYLTKQFKPVEDKIIMTGTNVTKGVEDLYGQLTWLDPNVLGFDTWGSFQGHFCTKGGFKDRQIIGYKNIDELIKLLDPHSFRVLKKDCLDLPQKIYKRWVVELNPRQREIYDQLRKDYYTELEGVGGLTANIGVVRLLRLQQITCGWFPADDSDELTPIPGDNPKLEAVRQHCFNTDGSILVWCKFKQDIKRLEEELKKDHGQDNVGTYYGETPNEIRSRNVKAFQSKQMKILIANRAAATGLTLTACENPIYHSNDFDLEIRLQSEDRCHRIGTQNSVVYTDVEAKGTTDRMIINSLRNKKLIADLVNQDPESVFLHG